MNEIDPKYHYELATEAQGELITKGGTDTRFSHGDDVAELKQTSWFHDNSGSETHPVAALKPNPFGLYDVHGNVWEWRRDWCGEYPPGALVDPKGPAWGSRRVVRGGSWSDGAEYLRSSRRYHGDPGNRGNFLGVRFVRTEK